jgi:hypothetical protein
MSIRPIGPWWLCIDEKSQIQALDRSAPLLPLRPGLPARQTHDYKRHGTTTLFAAFNILNGKVIGSCRPRHRGEEFIGFLNQLEKQVASELDIHLILDNYSTHKSAAAQRWLKPRKRRRSAKGIVTRMGRDSGSGGSVRAAQRARSAKRIREKPAFLDIRCQI